MATETRKRPTRGRSKKEEEPEVEVEETGEEAEEEAEAEASNGDKPKRDPSEVRYTLFTEDEDGMLTPLGDRPGYPGRNAKEAVKSYTKAEEHDGDLEVVVIPLRNMTRISVKVETTQKLRFD